MDNSNRASQVPRRSMTLEGSSRWGGRSSSVPAGLGQERAPAANATSSSSAAAGMPSPGNVGGGYSREDSSNDLIGAGPGSSSSSSALVPRLGQSPTLSPPQRSAMFGQPHPIDVVTHEEGEDFVEGGEELSPTRPLSEEEFGSISTQPLASLRHDGINQFWSPCKTLPKALFLDYDGTLREFEKRPEQAVPTPEIDALLQAINDRLDFRPHIISGRDATFLGRYFGHLSRFVLIAEHGFQISPQPSEDSERKWELWEHYGGDVKHFRDHENWKAIMRARIVDLVSSNPGSHLEEKQSSLVWHYREVIDEVGGEEVAAKAVEEMEQLRTQRNLQDVKISRGHKVVEVSYRNVRKGLVMRRLCEEKALFGEPYAAVLAAGDDVSDETMFEAAPHDFLTIKIGQGESLARFRAETPQELREFLQRLVQL